MHLFETQAVEPYFQFHIQVWYASIQTGIKIVTMDVDPTGSYIGMVNFKFTFPFV